MLVSHWMKVLALCLYLIATAWVLSQCDRLMAPAATEKGQPKTAAMAVATTDDSLKEEAASPMSKQAKRRADKRKAHQTALAERRAWHQPLEAELLDMISNDIPVALAELAQAAIRYRNKLSDLKHLKKAEQWERETPVKDALRRARALTEEWGKTDLEAQKEREGPTQHSPADIEALTKRLAAFKRGGEEIHAFAASLASLHGKVPESLLLSAIDAIPRAVLPKDAFDPCRDPAACPKPAVVEPLAEPPKTSFVARDFALGQRYCVDAAALGGRQLPLHIRPDPAAPIVVTVLPTSCRLTSTGRQAHRRGSAEVWIEVTHDYGYTGWVNASYLQRYR
jgi:hypothetical protein